MAAYPGDGYKMSNYGFKEYSPEQVKEQWREGVVREKKVRAWDCWRGDGGYAIDI